MPARVYTAAVDKVGAALSIPWTRVVVYMALLGAIGVGPLIHWQYQQANERAKDFVELEATVVTSRLEDGHRGKTYPFLRVTYEYEGRREWASETQAEDIAGAEALSDAELLARYPVGATLPVWVDPHNLKDAVFTLERESSPVPGPTILLLGVLGWVIWRDRQRIRAARAQG